MACIYKITNIINNKVYIGQTIYDTCAHRWKYYRNIIGKPYAPKIAIVHALNKYGYENFKFECIESDLKISQLDEREQYWIKYYDSYKKGYNETIGGHGKQRINDEEAEEMIQYYSEVKVISKVSEKFGHDSKTITQLFNMLNVHIYTQWEQKYDRLEEEVIPQIIDLYKSGLSVQKISEQLNLSKDFISRKLKEQGIMTNTQRKIKDKNLLLQLYKENNYNAKKTAEQLGVTLTTVSNNLKEFGIDTNHRIHKNVEDR